MAAHQWAMAPPFTSSLDRTQRRTTVGRTPLDEWSARRRDLYLTTHNTHNRQTSIPSVGFEPAIPAGERPQTYALDRAATWTGLKQCTLLPQLYSSFLASSVISFHCFLSCALCFQFFTPIFLRSFLTSSSHLNPLTPNDDYSGRTAPLTSKCWILYIYSTNIGTEYFIRGIYSPFCPLQNAVCFINLTYLVPVLFTLFIQGVLK